MTNLRNLELCATELMEKIYQFKEELSTNPEDTQLRDTINFLIEERKRVINLIHRGGN